MNRIATAIERMEKQIASRIAANVTTLAKVNETGKALDMEFDEYCKFQEEKSLFFAQGTISLEEAETVYGYLGNTVEHYNNQPVHVKAVLTQLFKEMLQKRIAS